MKKKLTIVVLLFGATLFSQGLEDFTNSTATNSYSNTSFIGQNNITWSFITSRNAYGDNNNSGIALPALMLKKSADGSKVTSSEITGGIGNFSVKLYKGFTGAGNRQVELFVNGVSKGVSVPFDDYEMHTFSVSDINVFGTVVIELKNITSKQVIIDDITWSAASTDPAITASTSLSNLNYYYNNGPSNVDSFSVSGSNLTADISVIAPTNFEISLSNSANFSTSLQLPQTSGSVATIAIFVRLIAGLSEGDYQESVSLSSAEADTKQVALSGSVLPASPKITVAAAMSNFSYTVGATATPAAQDFKVDGQLLTSNITVAAPPNYELSLLETSSYTNSLQLSPVNGTLAQTTVYIRLQQGLAINTYSGNVTISASGTTDKTIAVNGNVFAAPTNSLLITGVFDGTLSGGIPKGIELFVLKDIADLSVFGISRVINGGGSSGAATFTFPADAVTAGTFIYIATEAANFNTFFGFNPTYTSGVATINGDDAVELYENSQIIDVFGDINTDGTNTAWEYLDGWAYRKANRLPEGATFTLENWTFSGTNALENGTNNATSTTPFPISSYQNNTANVSTNSVLNFKLFPSPVTNKVLTLNTTLTGLKDVVMYSVLGTVVYKTQFTTSEKTIVIPHLKAGLYFVKLKADNLFSVKQLIVN